jgi:hypothetical protein
LASILASFQAFIVAFYLASVLASFKAFMLASWCGDLEFDSRRTPQHPGFTGSKTRQKESGDEDNKEQKKEKKERKERKERKEKELHLCSKLETWTWQVGKKRLI